LIIVRYNLHSSIRFRYPTYIAHIMDVDEEESSMWPFGSSSNNLDFRDRQVYAPSSPYPGERLLVSARIKQNYVLFLTINSTVASLTVRAARSNLCSQTATTTLIGISTGLCSAKYHRPQSSSRECRLRSWFEYGIDDFRHLIRSNE